MASAHDRYVEQQTTLSTATHHFDDATVAMMLLIFPCMRERRLVAARAAHGAALLSEYR